LQLRDTIRGWKLPHVDVGVAIHSLRAAAPASIHELSRACVGDAAPMHLHIAEQTNEGDDCLAATGLRPIEWLTRECALDARWQLVHATHATPTEIDAVAATGAGVVLCPGTEANLGDGLCDLPRWLQSGTSLSLGTDSHVTRSWPEELRLLEYGQRLTLRQRNVSADPATQPSTAARLVGRCLAGGATAVGHTRWGLVAGARADLLVLNPHEPALAGLPASHLMDGLVFAGASQPFARVMVAGKWSAPMETTVVFAAAMAALWS
jgi:formimidoylglutamate deiminase